MRTIRKPPRAQPDQLGWLGRLAGRYFWIFVLLLLALGLFLRAADLRSDPPPDLSWSFAPYTDESLNTYSARNFILYGLWKTDDFLPFVIYPLVNMLVALIFRLWGIGFVQVKLLSLLAGVLGILAVALLVREKNNPIPALLATLFYATCYPLVMYSRLGLVETLEILFLLLAGIAWLKGLKYRWLMPFAGFFATATVLLVKLSAIFIAPAMLILIIGELLTTPDRKQTLVSILYFLAGSGASLFIWYLLVYRPFHQEYIRYVLRHSSESPAGHPHNIAAYLLNTFTFGLYSRLVPRTVWLAVIGYLALPWLAVSRSRLFRYLLLWFIFGLLMLGYMNYRPPRYEIILLPCLLIAAATALGRLLQEGIVIPPTRPTITKTVLYGLWLTPLTLQAWLYLSGFRAFSQGGNETGILILALVIGLLIAFVGYGLIRLKPNGYLIKSAGLRAALVASLLLLSLRLDFGQWSHWFNNRTYDLFTYSKELDRILPQNAVVVGPWAPPLMIESTKKAIAVTDWANIDNPIDRFAATHIILGEGASDQLLWKKIPAPLRERATVLLRFQIRGQIIQLLALPQVSGL